MDVLIPEVKITYGMVNITYGMVNPHPTTPWFLRSTLHM